jgi:hypothetical protein
MRRPYHILYGDALDISRLCGALPILHSIIENHGARVWATRSPDRGATMEVDLP